MRERVCGVVRAREGGRARLREAESVASWESGIRARAEFSSIRDKKKRDHTVDVTDLSGLPIGRSINKQKSAPHSSAPNPSVRAMSSGGGLAPSATSPTTGTVHRTLTFLSLIHI